MASTTFAQSPTFSVTLCGRTYSDARLQFGTYVGGQTAINVVGPNGEHIATATANVPTFRLTHESCVLIKDYSENRGLAVQLQALGFIVPTGRYAVSGFVTLDEYEVTSKAVGEAVSPKRARARLVVEVDLDPVPGACSTRDDWRDWLQGLLTQNVGHYNPTVSVSSIRNGRIPAPCAHCGHVWTEEYSEGTPTHFCVARRRVPETGRV